MAVLDEEGRLFGVVNVVDVLVVFLAVAVVIVGVAVLTGGAGQQDERTPDRYAVIAFDRLPEPAADSLRVGETLTRDGSQQEFTVVDRYVTPGPNGTVRLVAQVNYTARSGAERLLGARTVGLHTGSYGYRGQILTTSDAPRNLHVTETPLLVETPLEQAAVSDITVGDSEQVANQTALRVRSVTAYPTVESNTRHALVGLELRTIRIGSEPTFAGQPVVNGTRLRVNVGSRVLSGEVASVGSTEPPGETADATLRVAWRNVRPSLAAALAESMAEQHRGADARITALSSAPTQVVVPDANGALHVRDHPSNRTVTITLDAQVRRIGDTRYFHGRPLERGRTVRLDFGEVSVRGTLLDAEGDG